MRRRSRPERSCGGIDCGRRTHRGCHPPSSSRPRLFMRGRASVRETRAGHARFAHGSRRTTAPRPLPGHRPPSPVGRCTRRRRDPTELAAPLWGQREALTKFPHRQPFARSPPGRESPSGATARLGTSPSPLRGVDQRRTPLGCCPAPGAVIPGKTGGNCDPLGNSPHA